MIARFSSKLGTQCCTAVWINFAESREKAPLGARDTGEDIMTGSVAIATFAVRWSMCRRWSLTISAYDHSQHDDQMRCSYFADENATPSG